MSEGDSIDRLRFRRGTPSIAGAVLFALLVFEGCAGREAPPDLLNGPKWQSALSEDTGDLDATLGALAKRGVDRPLQVLLLSGGGANGAWGAGVIRGWAEAPGGRPAFDLVAGVSTGALLATHVLLGQPEDDLVLEKNYTQISRDDVISDRFLLWVPFSSSFTSSEPLRQLIGQWITDDVVDRVSKEGKKGRVLLVGTVNMDRGRLEIWNLTEIAMSTRPDRYERYRQILLASSSFPILMPPILIDDEMQADGALRGRLFAQRVLKPIQVASGAPAPEVRLIVNGKGGLAVEFTKENILSVGRRALNVMLDDNLVGAIDTARQLAQTNRFNLSWCRIPETDQMQADPAAFDTEEMRALFERARRFGRGDPAAGSWEAVRPH